MSDDMDKYTWVPGPRLLALMARAGLEVPYEPRCTTCGGSLAEKCIGGGFAEPGEGFCSDACYDQYVDAARGETKGEADV